MKKIILAAGLVFSLSGVFSLSAETVVLKSGQKAQGRILSQDAQSVKMDVNGVEVTYFRDEIERLESSSTSDPEAQQQQARPEAVSVEEDGQEIAINPMIELDGMTKSEVLDVRRYYVRQHPDLARPNYVPSEAVYGQIADKKPWWGIEGISCYGPGERSIEGPSEESRLLANPYLLMAVTEDTVPTNPGQISYLNYPRVLKLFWHSSRDWAKATFDVGTYRSVRGNHADDLSLDGLNARDYGFTYLYIDPSQTRGIQTSPLSPQPIALKQFIHCGGSCRYPGGCNNMSPYEPHMILKIVSLPAWVPVKLWVRPPANAQQPPDMVFILELV